MGVNRVDGGDSNGVDSAHVDHMDHVGSNRVDPPGLDCADRAAPNGVACAELSGVGRSAPNRVDGAGLSGVEPPAAHVNPSEPDRADRPGELIPADDGCRLWTTAVGEGETVILCHGGPGLWDMFGDLAAALATRLRAIR
ncbi:hypothetical protein AB0F91_05725 [Amycolatopsis sp. NPDC023774]|uniref:hypothetical protein n=1 Tax=Amycolatopsis sp. NPDC023774 TaxID=3155015 RepID=UPI0033FD11C2